MILYEAEQRQFKQACEQLCQDTLGRAVFMIDVNGQIISSAGRFDGVDTTGMASLIAGTMLASGGLAKLLGEDDFPTHYYEGKRAHLYTVKVGDMLILSVVFDHQSSLGLVRLRVGRALAGLKRLHDQLAEQQSSQPSGSALFGGLDLSDDAIDDMFKDVL